MKPSEGLASHFSSIDQLLGSSQSRYFGAGFRQVRQHIRDVHLDRRGVRATAQIVYPAAWSTKKNRELQPHLSSIDALAVGAQLCEAYVRAAYGVEGAAADRTWVRRIVLKSSNVPTLELDAVPAVFELVKTEAAPDARCGHLSHFTGRVGAMGVELVVDHPLVAATGELVAHYADLAEALGPLDRRYYGAAYTTAGLDLRDVELAPDGLRVRALLDFDQPALRAPLLGLGASEFPFVSGANAIVSVAQLAQAMLYRHDNVTRESSNNLWMRKIMIDSPEPAPAGRGLGVETWCEKSTLLHIKGAVWRSASFIVKMPGVYGEYSLAHQLPSP